MLVRNDDDVVFVQLRLPRSLAVALREEGERHGRKLPSEIIHRLRQPRVEGRRSQTVDRLIDELLRERLREGRLTLTLED